MRLTPMEINNKDFKKGIRGYNADEVDEFLDKIVEDYEELYKENSTLKEKLNSYSEKIEHYAKIENTIQNTLLLAQNTAEQAKANAQKEAELIIKNANETAQKILDKAHNDVIQINDEYDKVKQEFSRFRAKFKNFIHTQMQTFEDLERDFMKNFKISSTYESIDEKDIHSESNNLRFDDISENNVNSDELNEIKSFFANK